MTGHVLGTYRELRKNVGNTLRQVPAGAKGWRDIMAVGGGVTGRDGRGIGKV